MNRTILKTLKNLKNTVKEYARKHRVNQRQAKFEVLDDLFEDLPDGAYFAAMEENGFDADAIIECSEQRK